MSVPHYILFALLESTGNRPEYMLKTKHGSLKETAQQNCHRLIIAVVLLLNISGMEGNGQGLLLAA